MADARTLETSKTSKLINAVGIYGIVLIFLVLGILLQATTLIRGFLSIQNLLNIIDSVALFGIVAVGMAFVTYSGNYADLSVPTTMALSGYVAIETLRFGIVPSLLAALAVGLLFGIINGFVVGKLKANPIIWTLAVSYMTLGIIRLVWVNKQIYPDVQGADLNAVNFFDSIYRLRFFDLIGLPLVILIIMVIIGQFVLTKTAFGAKLKLTGASIRAAKFSGIKVEWMVASTFILCAIAATIGGLAVTSLSRVGAWYNGAGYDFKAVTAVVIGGVTLAGGRGSILGVLGGCLIIGLMSNIMTLLGVGTFSQDMIRGAVFIAVVWLNSRSLRKMGRDDA